MKNFKNYTVTSLIGIGSFAVIIALLSILWEVNPIDIFQEDPWFRLWVSIALGYSVVAAIWQVEYVTKAPILKDKKFRFKIGDKVMFNGKEYEILAYYFSNGFRNYSNTYGYTISYPFHNGNSFSYNEKGEAVVFAPKSAIFIGEKGVDKANK